MVFLNFILTVVIVAIVIDAIRCGGGTVAVYVANLGVDVVDLGVPVLSMHAPYEVVGKLDVYMTYRACCEFFKAK